MLSHWRTCTLLLAAALPSFGGGFWIQFTSTDANPEARSKNAAFVVKATGCHNPERATVTGTAEGIVSG